MKYLKTFENNTNTYNIGDYVYLNLHQIDKNNKEAGYTEKIPDSPFARILEYSPEFKHYPYEIEINLETENQMVKHNEILRRMTQEEIKEYKIKKTSNKYNL